MDKTAILSDFCKHTRHKFLSLLITVLGDSCEGKLNGCMTSDNHRVSYCLHAVLAAVQECVTLCPAHWVLVVHVFTAVVCQLVITFKRSQSNNFKSEPQQISPPCTEPEQQQHGTLLSGWRHPNTLPQAAAPSRHGRWGFCRAEHTEGFWNSYLILTFALKVEVLFYLQILSAEQCIILCIAGSCVACCVMWSGMVGKGTG